MEPKGNGISLPQHKKNEIIAIQVLTTAEVSEYLYGILFTNLCIVGATLCVCSMLGKFTFMSTGSLCECEGLAYE